MHTNIRLAAKLRKALSVFVLRLSYFCNRTLLGLTDGAHALHSEKQAKRRERERERKREYSSSLGSVSCSYGSDGWVGRKQTQNRFVRELWLVA